MERPKAMKTIEAVHWMMDHPRAEVRSELTGCCMFFKNSQFWCRDEGFVVEWDLDMVDPDCEFIIKTDYLAWQASQKEPERKSIEELAIEEHKLLGIGEYIGASERCSFKAIERYIEQRLAEVAK